MEREQLGSRLGFILLSAGCAIGLGNVWKFPYMTGQYGGGIFVLIYLFFLLVLGIPAMTMEFSMGRAAQKSPVKIYQVLHQKGSYWYIHGYLTLIGSYVLMMFYTGVAGWLLNYFVKMAQGTFNGLEPKAVAGIFGGMLGNTGEMLFYMAIVICLGFGVCAIGLQKGLERISKYMMLLLLGIMGVLVVNSFLLQGYEGDMTKLWESNIFGRSLYEIAGEGIEAKLVALPENARGKLQDTLQKIINDGSGMLICILL